MVACEECLQLLISCLSSPCHPEALPPAAVLFKTVLDNPQWLPRLQYYQAAKPELNSNLLLLSGFMSCHSVNPESCFASVSLSEEPMVLVEASIKVCEWMQGGKH